MQYTGHKISVHSYCTKTMFSGPSVLLLFYGCGGKKTSYATKHRITGDKSSQNSNSKSSFKKNKIESCWCLNCPFLQDKKRKHNSIKILLLLKTCFSIHKQICYHGNTDTSPGASQKPVFKRRNATN